MTAPALTPIKSSLFTAHGYDPNTRTMTLQFSNGDVWSYRDVPAEKAAAFAESASPGRYFGAKIKGLYAGRKAR